MYIIREKILILPTILLEFSSRDFLMYSNFAPCEIRPLESDGFKFTACTIFLKSTKTLKYFLYIGDLTAFIMPLGGSKLSSVNHSKKSLKGSYRHCQRVFILIGKNKAKNKAKNKS
jgi:hypothetical protein